MTNPFHSYNELKRRVYLFALPAVFLATLFSIYILMSQEKYNAEYYFYVLFLFLFSIGWVLAYKRKLVLLVEYVIMFVASSYYLLILSMEVVTSIRAPHETFLSAFVIWMPIILMLYFMVLQRKKALVLSLVLLVASIIPAIIAYNELTMSFKESLFQLYLATVLYMGVLYFSYNMFLAFAENKVLRQQYYLDSLTKIGNRNQIDLWLTEYIAEAEQDKGFSILFFDIDYFKLVNDRFGHVIGDEVLKKVARSVEDELTDGQLFGRWGGEEFIVLVQSSECNAYQLAERLRSTIEEYHFGEIDQLTASFGVTEYKAGDTINSILERCDELLYLSKKRGRNRVTGRKSEESFE